MYEAMDGETMLKSKNTTGIAAEIDEGEKILNRSIPATLPYWILTLCLSNPSIGTIDEYNEFEKPWVRRPEAIPKEPTIELDCL